jgi:hypothetical protein
VIVELGAARLANSTLGGCHRGNPSQGVVTSRPPYRSLEGVAERRCAPVANRPTSRTSTDLSRSSASFRREFILSGYFFVLPGLMSCFKASRSAASMRSMMIRSKGATIVCSVTVCSAVMERV